MAFLILQPFLMKKFGDLLLSIVSSSGLLLVFSSIDFLSFGTKLLNPTSHGKSAESISAILFLYSSIAAQIVFGGLSKLRGGVCGGTIVEGMKDTHRIHQVCMDMSNSFEEAIFSTYICIFISTFLYAGFSLFLRAFKVGRFLKSFPKLPLYGVMGSIGLISLECGYNEIYAGNQFEYAHYCFVISVASAILMMVLDIKHPSYFMMVPVFVLGVVFIFYTVFIIAGKDLAWLRAAGLIPQAKIMNLMFTELSSCFSVSNINLKAIMSNWKNIIGLALFNMIHIVVNVPGIAEYIGLDADMDSELQVQSIGNFVSAFFGYPTYHICSTSIYFNKSGGRRKIHSMFGVISIAILLFAGPSIRSVLPILLPSTVPMFIGFGFIYSYIYLQIFRLSYPDVFVLLSSAAIAWLYMPMGGLVFGTVVNLLFHLFFYKSQDSEARVENSTTESAFENGKECVQETTVLGKDVYKVVDVDFVVFFWRVEKMRKLVGKLDTNVVFDARKCGYFSADANISLEEIVNEIVNRGHKIAILGNPPNMYVHTFWKHMTDVSPSSPTVVCPQ